MRSPCAPQRAGVAPTATPPPWCLTGGADVSLRHAEQLAALIGRDPQRQRLLALVASLNLPDCWIGAGFVRNAVWDALHGRAPSAPGGDVDVIWFDAANQDRDVDQALERRLLALDGAVAWSVKNQARMHAGNGDRPYTCASDAMRHWPETATATALRYGADGALEIAAPFGLDDLFGALLRPGPCFAHAKRAVFDQRVARKQWLTLWPLLRLADASR